MNAPPQSSLATGARLVVAHAGAADASAKTASVSTNGEAERLADCRCIAHSQGLEHTHIPVVCSRALRFSVWYCQPQARSLFIGAWQVHTSPMTTGWTQVLEW